MALLVVAICMFVGFGSLAYGVVTEEGFVVYIVGGMLTLVVGAAIAVRADAKRNRARSGVKQEKQQCSD